MSGTVAISDPTLAKIRAILALEGITGQAGEVVINLHNTPGNPRLFQSASVEIQGAYSVNVSTDDTFFLSMRPDGHLLAHVGPNTGSTSARFTISRVDGFEYQLSKKETRYTFIEHKPTVENRLHVTIRWS